MNLDEILGINPKETLAERAQQLLEADRHLIREIRRHRVAAGLTQTEVARKMDISQQAVARIEKADRDLNQETIRRYAMAVGVVVTHTVTKHEPVTERVRQMDAQVAVTLSPNLPWTDKVNVPSRPKVTIG